MNAVRGIKIGAVVLLVIISLVPNTLAALVWNWIDLAVALVVLMAWLFISVKRRALPLIPILAALLTFPVSPYWPYMADLGIFKFLKLNLANWSDATFWAGLLAEAYDSL